MTLFHRSPRTTETEQFVELFRDICKEEGIPSDQDLEAHLLAMPRPHTYHCGGSCPMLVWMRKGKPDQCPTCGRPVSELIPDYSRDFPQQARDAFAAEAHMRYSGKCFQEGKFKDAEASLTRVLVLRPDFEDAYHNRAQVRNAMNSFAGAIEDCDAVMRINPKGADTLVTRAGLKLQTGNMAGAAEDANSALEMGSKKTFAYFVKGFALLQLGHIDEARVALQKYLELAPEEPRSAFVKKLLGEIAG